MGHAASLQEMKESFANCLQLHKRLIALHPVYGAPTQKDAAAIIARFMRENGWDAVKEITYRSADISSLREYVDVAALGSLYATDAAIDKTNVIGVIDSKIAGPTLIINGHYDVDIVTSLDRWRGINFWRSAHQEEDRVYGRGATDMLGGLCAALAGASLFSKHKDDWQGRIIFMAVTDEEVGGNGTLNGLKWLADADLMSKDRAVDIECIIPEPTEGRVCTESLGLVQCRIDVQHSSSHMGAGSSESNAYLIGHQALINLNTAIDAAVQNFSERRETFVVNFGRIKSGEDPSIKPASFTAEGVLFFPSSVHQSDLVRSVTSEFMKLGPTEAQISFGAFGFDGAKFGGGRLRDLASNLSRRYIHIGDALFRSPCDARLLRAYGIETIVCGPGRLEQAHSIDEFIRLADISDYYCDFVELVQRYLARVQRE